MQKMRNPIQQSQKTEVPDERNLKPGAQLTRSQRHLTKPLRRYGLENES